MFLSSPASDVDFAWRLLLRLLMIVAPFLVVAVLVAQHWLTEYDINYNLQEKPPALIRVVVIDGLLLAVMSIVLIRKVLGWSIALPLVLFSDVAPRESFARSEAILQGQRLPLLLTLIGWAVISAVLLAGAASRAAAGAIDWSADHPGSLSRGAGRLHEVSDG